MNNIINQNLNNYILRDYNKNIEELNIYDIINSYKEKKNYDKIIAELDIIIPKEFNKLKKIYHIRGFTYNINNIYIENIKTLKYIKVDENVILSDNMNIDRLYCKSFKGNNCNIKYLYVKYCQITNNNNINNLIINNCYDDIIIKNCQINELILFNCNKILDINCNKIKIYNDNLKFKIKNINFNILTLYINKYNFNIINLILKLLDNKQINIKFINKNEYENFNKNDFKLIKVNNKIKYYFNDNNLFIIK